MGCPICGQEHEEGACPVSITESSVPPTPPTVIASEMTGVLCPDCGHPLEEGRPCPVCAKRHTLPTVALVLALLGLCTMGITAIAALIMGIHFLRQMQQAPHRYHASDRGNAISAVVIASFTLLLGGSCAVPALMSSLNR